MRLLAVLICAPGLLMADEHWIYAPMVDACYTRSMEDGGPESCIGDAATACMDGEEGGHSTVGMMFCMLGERDAWDVLLNQEYQNARAFARGLDEQSQEHFPEYAVRDDQVLAAQRAWVAFRDANCSMAYGLWGEGSMRQIAGSRCQMQMTAEQTLALRAYQEIMR